MINLTKVANILHELMHFYFNLRVLFRYYFHFYNSLIHKMIRDVLFTIARAIKSFLLYQARQNDASNDVFYCRLLPEILYIDAENNKFPVQKKL